jgi:hypothetical protein
MENRHRNPVRIQDRKQSASSRFWITRPLKPQSMVLIDLLILSSLVRLLIRFEKQWWCAGLYTAYRLALFLVMPGLQMNPWLAAGLVAAASSAYFWTLIRLDSGDLVWWIVAIPVLFLLLWLVTWI